MCRPKLRRGCREHHPPVARAARTRNTLSIWMYIRFVIEEHDEDSQEPLGLFQAVADLRDDGHLSRDERVVADKIFAWFNKNLPEPERFSRSNKRSAKAVAISWFKPTAHEYIERMQGLAGILYAHDIPTKVVKTRRPGYIVYEDDYQVVAQPFSGRK